MTLHHHWKIFLPGGGLKWCLKHVLFTLLTGSSTNIGAASPADYSAAMLAIRQITPAARRRCLNITINYDFEAESVESFGVVVTGRNLPSYVSLSLNATVSIRNVYRKSLNLHFH
jgi:hypothetical protein